MSTLPMMIMMIGLPGSGKSTLARHITIGENGIEIGENVNDTGNPVIHSSDDLRAEMFGDIDCQSKNDKLFAELHRRIKEDLRVGKNVVYDATNINKKQRANFLSELKNIPCVKCCIAVMTMYENCIENNKKRLRKVPERAIRRMYLNWQPPHFHEGFDEIHMAFLDKENANLLYTPPSLTVLYDRMRNFDQGNSHHKYDLFEHCYRTMNNVITGHNYHKLQLAAFFHDIGKLETKTTVNGKGVEDGNCHYYQHHCVGAYMAAFYISTMAYTVEEVVDVLNLIYFHMHPYCAWKQSKKAKERDINMIGEEMYNDIMTLHEADVNAHG